MIVPPTSPDRSGFPGRLGPAKALDRSLSAFFWDGVRITFADPRQAWQFFRTVRWQAAAAKARAEWRERGLQVPPIVIFSITHQCSLACAGCYARSFHDSAERTPVGLGNGSRTSMSDELSDARLGSIVAEAGELGVSFFVTAGRSSPR